MFTQPDIVKTKAESNWRWAILFLTCIMMIGNYYCYDIPASLNSQMDEYFGKPSDFETSFSLLYTVYSIPNVILPFFGGYFVDRLGVRTCMLIFAVLISVGQLTFAIGLSAKSWPLMFLGRVIFGFGGENLGVANSAILSVWFKGKELAFAFGLNLSIARLGSVFNNLLSPALANDFNIQFAFWFGVILCASSIASVLFIASVDRYLDGVLEQNHNREGLLNNVADDDDEKAEKKRIRAVSTESIIEQVKFSDIFSYKQVFWILAFICVIVYGCVLPFNNIASALLLERDYFMYNPSDCTLTNPLHCEGPNNPPIAACPTSKWYQPPIPSNFTYADIDCSSSYYKDTCTPTYCSRQSSAQVQTGTIMSIPYIISATLSPFLGGFVDRFGMRAIIATIAPLVLVMVHSFMAYSSCTPVGPLVGQGLAYSGFASVVWPSVAMVVEDRLVGLGYGIVVSIQNIGLAIFPVIIAQIYTDADNHYIPNVEMFFVGLAAAGTLIGIYLNFYDHFFLNDLLNSGRKPEVADVDGSDTRNPMRDDA